MIQFRDSEDRLRNQKFKDSEIHMHYDCHHRTQKKYQKKIRNRDGAINVTHTIYGCCYMLTMTKFSNNSFASSLMLLFGVLQGSHTNPNKTKHEGHIHPSICIKVFIPKRVPFNGESKKWPTRIGKNCCPYALMYKISIYLH